jgi:hypothetical protein
VEAWELGELLMRILSYWAEAMEGSSDSRELADGVEVSQDDL